MSRTQHGESDFSHYARRRLRLAGHALVESENPYFKPLDDLRRAAAAGGAPFTSFANYDYLGLCDDPRIKRAAQDAITQFGAGVGASRLVGGERSIHRALERGLSSFLGVEDALALVSGYGANVSLLGHIMARGDAIFIDELSHNSIVAGSRLSRAAVFEFPHNDLEQLEQILESRRGQFRRALIVVEGLYSMDGDVPDLPRLIELKSRYDAWIMVDEAHSIGVLGETGRGLSEYFSVDTGAIDLIVGTLSKSLVSCGGFIGGARTAIDWLRFTLPGFVYSVGLAPPIAASALQALVVLEQEPARIARLRDNSQYFLQTARRAGLDTGSALGLGVVPILLETAEQTLNASRSLMRNGFYVPPIVQVGVPKDKPRLRFFISASHLKEQIDAVVRETAEAIRSSGSVTPGPQAALTPAYSTDVPA